MPAVVTRRSRLSYAADIGSLEPSPIQTPIERVTHDKGTSVTHFSSKISTQWKDDSGLDNIRLTLFGYVYRLFYWPFVFSITNKLSASFYCLLKKNDGNRLLLEIPISVDSSFVSSLFYRPERTDYTYGDSGSYRTDRILEKWKSPRMARLPLRTLVEPQQKATTLYFHEETVTTDMSKSRDHRKNVTGVSLSTGGHNLSNRETGMDDDTDSRNHSYCSFETIHVNSSENSSVSGPRILRSRCKQIQGEWCTHAECMVSERRTRRQSVDRQRNTNNTTSLLVEQDENNTTMSGVRTRNARRSARTPIKTTVTVTPILHSDPIDNHATARTQHLGASSSTYVYQYVPHVDSADAALDLTTQPPVSGDGPGGTGLADGTEERSWAKRHSTIWSRPAGPGPAEPAITAHSSQKVAQKLPGGSRPRSWLARHILGLENDGHNGSDDASGNFISSDIEENESTLDESRISRRRIQRSDSDARIRPSHRTMKPVSNMCEFGFRGVQFIRRGIIEGLALIIAVLFALGNLFLSTIRLVAHTVQRIFLKLFMPNAPIYLTEKPIHPRLSHFHEDKDSGRSVISETPFTHRIVFTVWTGLKRSLRRCCHLIGFLCFLIPLLLLLAFLFAPVAVDEDASTWMKPFPSDAECNRSVADVLPPGANPWRTMWWRFRCLYYHYILTPAESQHRASDSVRSFSSLWAALTYWWSRSRSDESKSTICQIPNLRSTDARVTDLTQESKLSTKELNNQMMQLQGQLNLYVDELKRWQVEWQTYHPDDSRSQSSVDDSKANLDSLMHSKLSTLNQSVLLQLDALRAELRADQSGYWKQHEKSLSQLSVLLSNLRFQLTYRVRQTEHELDKLRFQLRNHLEKRASNDQDTSTIVLELKSAIANLEKQYFTLHKVAVRQCNEQMLNGKEDCRRAVTEQFSSGISQLTDQLTAQITSLVEDVVWEPSRDVSQSRVAHELLQSKAFESRYLAIEIRIIMSYRLFQNREQRLDFSFDTSPHRLMNMSDVHTIQGLIDTALQRFAADRTGLADFALESAGGAIVGTRCTKTYTDGSALFSIFGIPLARLSNSPRTILQPGNNPGECWPFHGSSGQAVIRLSSPIFISAVSLEHLSRTLAPNERLDSAPKDFVIKGLDSEFDETGVVLGNFTYNINGPPIQTFAIRNQTDPRQYIEFAVLSNHGHPLYTCVYRLRVHGTMPG
ncbi:SUN domain-containing protein 1 [Fasciolopsis buskii]|uniref:SUN domain-containing protein 1 n=1 Tax=Fasciolopsis buskii TaxID=27845 RepID=A0A8E0RWJ0_9TREM|nr:SUN domain-containing protein 1 [Fasciolopsis buski]